MFVYVLRNCKAKPMYAC